MTKFGPVSESVHVHWRTSCPTIVSLACKGVDNRLTPQNSCSSPVCFVVVVVVVVVFIVVCRLLVWHLFVLTLGVQNGSTARLLTLLHTVTLPPSLPKFFGGGKIDFYCGGDLASLGQNSSCVRQRPGQTILVSHT